MTADNTPALPASLGDAHLIPWLVILDYGDADVMDSIDWLRTLAEFYEGKAAAVRALVEKFGAPK